MTDFPRIIILRTDSNEVVKDVSSISESSVSSNNSASLTKRKIKYTLNIPITNLNVKAKWMRAFTKLRGVYLLNKIKKDIQTYGTNSHLLDAFGKYRKYLVSIMEDKVKDKKFDESEIVVYRYHVIMPNGKFYQYWNLILFSTSFSMRMLALER